MSDGTGLRERKKQRTRRAISEAAISLFLEHGFDKVSVADVAAVADVSKMTVFNYFPTKEDLVVHRFEDHFDHFAAVLKDRKPGESALSVQRRHFLAGLDRRDVVTGLNDDEHFLAFQRMVLSAPSLRLRVLEQATHSVAALASALREQTGAEPGDIAPLVAASQLYAVQTELVRENVRRLAAGESADAVYPDAVAAAQRAFELLENGLRDYCS
ncbi:TetR/AcrR family transcriptional regulator [Streptomyces sp. NPDC054933]